MAASDAVSISVPVYLSASVAIFIVLWVSGDLFDWVFPSHLGHFNNALEDTGIRMEGLITPNLHTAPISFDTQGFCD